MSLNNENFFWVKDEAISPELCKNLIKKFEMSPNKEPGRAGFHYIPTHKQSTDLFISGLPEFAEEDQSLSTALTLGVNEYVHQLKQIPWALNFRDTGYKVQRTEPGQFYHWHSDFYIDLDFRYVRVLTFIWYLNDITDGGETEFYNGFKVQPKQGRLLMFPADYTVYHRGVPPVSETKYICTGWMHINL
jgi:hypothetical protein